MHSAQIQQAIYMACQSADEWLQIKAPNAEIVGFDLAQVQEITSVAHKLLNAKRATLIGETRTLIRRMPRWAVDKKTANREELELRVAISDFVDSLQEVINTARSEGYYDPDGMVVSRTREEQAPLLDEIERLLHEARHQLDEFRSEVRASSDRIETAHRDLTNEIKGGSKTSISFGPLSVETDRLVEVLDGAINELHGHVRVSIDSINRQVEKAKIAARKIVQRVSERPKTFGQRAIELARNVFEASSKAAIYVLSAMKQAAADLMAASEAAAVKEGRLIGLSSITRGLMQRAITELRSKVKNKKLFDLTVSYRGCTYNDTFVSRRDNSVRIDKINIYITHQYYSEGMTEVTSSASPSYEERLSHEDATLLAGCNHNQIDNSLSSALSWVMQQYR